MLVSRSILATVSSGQLLESVLCTLYSVLCILYSVLFTLYSVLYTLYSVLCTGPGARDMCAGEARLDGATRDTRHMHAARNTQRAGG